MVVLIGFLTAGLAAVWARRWMSPTARVYGIVCSGLVGTLAAVCWAALVRGEGAGFGVDGETIEHSRKVIVAGFWLAWGGAIIGTALPIIFPKR